MESNSDKKRMTPALKATIVFLCAALVLTFFSKTIYNAGIPTVYVSTVKSGSLDVKYTGDGVIEPKEVTELYATEDLVITDVLVKQYDMVQTGDVLAVFDTSDLEDQLLDMQTEYEKLIASRNNAHGEARKLMDLDVSDMERHIERLSERIEHGSKMYAPSDGIITKLSACKGMMAGRTAPLFELGNAEQGYVIKQVISDENARYYSKAVVYLTGTDVKEKITGKITGRTPSTDGNIEIAIELKPERTQLQPDMLVMIELSGKTEDFTAVVPAQAVSNESYVFLLTESKGPLGTDYYVRQTKVTTEAQNDDFVAVTGELSKGDQVVIRSDKVLSDERVKIGH